MLATRLVGPPVDLVHSVFTVLLTQDTLTHCLFKASWLDIVFMFHVVGDFHVPVFSPDTCMVMPVTLRFTPPQPTVAVQVRLLRKLQLFGLESALARGESTLPHPDSTPAKLLKGCFLTEGDNSK